MFRYSRASFLIVAGLLVSSACHAANFTGRVLLPDGNPAFGAMLTVFDETRQNRETGLYRSGRQLRYPHPFCRKLQVRARLAGYDDATLSAAGGEHARQELSLTLKSFDGTEPATMSLAASAFNARLPWAGDFSTRAAFVSQCNYCHQLGNATTRVPRSHQEWLDEINKMEGILALPTQREKTKIAQVLAKGFDGQPVQAAQTYGASAELARAKVREWNAGDDFTFIHDADVARDQKVYGTDEGHDLLWVLDRQTGKIESHRLPDIDLPRGGYFSGMKLPIGVFSGKHGPHSMAQTPDGRIWITNSLSSTLMSFDPESISSRRTPSAKTRSIRTRSGRMRTACMVHCGGLEPCGALRPRYRHGHGDQASLQRDHSVGVGAVAAHADADWQLVPDQALHLDLSTHRLFGYKVLPFPYGIDVNPVDGSIWYAKLYASKIGRIDPVMLAIQEWDTPMKGPRRPRFDLKGVLWIRRSMIAA